MIHAPGPVGRDDAAAALGISRELAAFHLDRLVGGGLLATEYRRRGERRGPGAGRPAKFYRPAAADVAVSIPPRAYEQVADVFAEALDRLDTPVGAVAVAEIARTRGSGGGNPGPGPGRRSAGGRRARAALVELLRESGYQPRIDAADRSIRLRNCPYATLSAGHRDLTCGMNLAWAEGVLAGLGDPRLEAELAPEPGSCCVRFERASSRPARPQADLTRPLRDVVRGRAPRPGPRAVGFGPRAPGTAGRGRRQPEPPA